MKLDLNTNGAWRTVLRGLSYYDPPGTIDTVKHAALELSLASAALGNKRPITWRLVSEADDRPVEYCSAEGWKSADETARVTERAA